jgi:nucleotide-binding universal stress UspA family protein
MISKPRESAEDAGSRPRVVVGVDGSAPSVRALSCAAEEAAWRGAALVVVNAWQCPEDTGYPGYAVVTMEPATAFEQRARDMIAGALLEAFDAAGPPVPVMTRIVESTAPAALLAEAEGALLLVVGSRGLGSLRSIPGSTSRRCVAHATCPVLVVHPAPAHHDTRRDARHDIRHRSHEAPGTARREKSEPPMRVPLF